MKHIAVFITVDTDKELTVEGISNALKYGAFANVKFTVESLTIGNIEGDIENEVAGFEAKVLAEGKSVIHSVESTVNGILHRGEKAASDVKGDLKGETAPATPTEAPSTTTAPSTTEPATAPTTA